ncbi:Uncharacterized protein PECH_003615 [Penicillium ucsense]|uniref:BZIP domain-containing protein n=1 Tax=Penicillium ucsense TaxID=2839758 RepID=A0A8J8WEZ7_9EURO|nr:Uncharacterized protein PECM_003114 [Penicillium ucsense]KAF7729285.1 Uncharacterized protein PECH_003615 [Penicillium ucsense]
MSKMTEHTTDPTLETLEVSREEWLGLTDRAERRRTQNRINQRARRMRQRLCTRDKKDIHPKTVTHTTSSSTTSKPSSSRSSSNSSASSSTLVQVPRSGGDGSQPPPGSSHVADLTLTNPRRGNCPPTSLTSALVHQFAEAAVRSYTLGSPTSDHLLTLAKMNVFRAFGRNITIIGWDLDYLHDDDAISPFSLQLPGPYQKQLTSSSTTRSPSPSSSSGAVDLDTDYSNLPVSLRPTRLQKSIPHHPWLDFFPLPKMRDNLIQAGDDWDDEALCHDIMGFWDNASLSTPALLVWGDPWDIRNWELTEAFLKKWSWIVRGCPEIMDATNSWRRKRGEKLILRYI